MSKVDDSYLIHGRRYPFKAHIPNPDRLDFHRYCLLIGLGLSDGSPGEDNEEKIIAGTCRAMSALAHHSQRIFEKCLDLSEDEISLILFGDISPLLQQIITASLNPGDFR